jgi:o-succinylbenzoate synthase
VNLWFHRYTLVPLRPLSPVARGAIREGALLRTEHGFADVHPWQELGDASLDEQLALLARGETTPLTRASLRLLDADQGARRRGVSLFAGLAIPESHWPGADPPAAFDTVKLKQLDTIPDGVRLRIDFNERLTPETFLETANRLPRERVDFIEDPVPYDAEVWSRIRAEGGCRLALDRAPADLASTVGVDVVVHKPALSDRFPTFNGEVVVTSYMDHPVGQFGAAWVAASNRVSARCGLMTHVLFEPDAFIDRITCDGSRLLPPGGTGVGFDDLLEALPWTRLR